MMKNILFILLMLVLCVSCDKVPMNGDLDGMWQLMVKESKDKNNGEWYVENVKSDKVYMSFQLHLVQLDGPDEGNGGRFRTRLYYGRFKHEGDSLFIYELSYDSKNETAADNNEWIKETELDILEPWGLNSLNNRFKVVKLDSDAMILRRDDLVLTYRKF